MPVHIGKRDGKWRVLERDGSLATTPKGHARDGGGFSTREKALRQMRAINMHLREAKARKSLLKALRAIGSALRAI